MFFTQLLVTCTIHHLYCSRFPGVLRSDGLFTLPHWLRLFMFHVFGRRKLFRNCVRLWIVDLLRVRSSLAFNVCFH